MKLRRITVWSVAQSNDRSGSDELQFCVGDCKLFAPWNGEDETHSNAALDRERSSSATPG
jgi:hypothetical protein